jgi:uncharacterized protein
MTNNPVVWFEIYVQDIQRAKKFYEVMLGVKLEKAKAPGPGLDEMFTFPMEMKASGASGALVKMEGGPSGGGSSVIVYFECDDCAVESKRVPLNGGKVMKEKFAIGEHGFMSVVSDTEGNVIGLHSMK